EASVSARPAIPANPELEALVERLRAIMAERRDDPTGWRLLAENELRLGNFEAAVAAQEQLVGLLDPQTPEGAAVRANLAEMMILAAGGYVSPEAEAVLNDTIAQEPRNGTARYYMGLMYAQGGRPDLAYTIWRTLLAESTPDAPWLEPIRLQIEEVAFLAGDPINVDDLPQPRREDAPLRGPDAAQMEAAGQMSAEDRAAMIEGMVGNLSARLANEGGTVEEYAQLITALGVLGRLDEARTILAEARANFAGQDGAAAVLDNAEAGLPQ
ncbi:MAG: c-type cytochrome biogenesis protein CcmI, partial [Rhodobacteraceae bacterium]|nr:c-type cytochrome biogenesis protein CcmI [Paracoccaceae bacterium]